MVAADTDPFAVTATEMNAALNGVALVATMEDPIDGVGDLGCGDGRRSVL